MEDTKEAKEVDYEFEPESTSKFLTLRNDGDVIRVRIVSTPVHYQSEVTFAGEAKTKENFCWLVIDRKDSKVKILKGGTQIYLKIRDFAKDDDLGDPTGYDIKIKRNGGAPANFYTVIPGKLEALTEEDKKLVKESNLILKDEVEGQGTKTFGEAGQTPEMTEASDGFPEV